MLAPQLDGTADVVSPGTNGKSGHLTVVRNAPRTNELAMHDPVYKDVLVSREHWAYTTKRAGVAAPSCSSFWAM